MKTVNVSGRVPMLLSMSKYCVMSSKSTTSFDEAPLICSFDVKSLIEFLRPARIRHRWKDSLQTRPEAPFRELGVRGGTGRIKP